MLYLSSRESGRKNERQEDKERGTVAQKDGKTRGLKNRKTERRRERRKDGKEEGRKNRGKK